MTYHLLRADARALPLPDDAIDHLGPLYVFAVSFRFDPFDKRLLDIEGPPLGRRWCLSSQAEHMLALTPPGEDLLELHESAKGISTWMGGAWLTSTGVVWLMWTAGDREGKGVTR